MKVTVKLTVAEFQSLLSYVQKSTYENINELQILNIRLFLSWGLKKLIDFKNTFGYSVQIKKISLEVNQYTAVMALLTNERNNLDPYMLAIFLTIQNQTKSLLKLV